jgi:hypothetical protein
MPCGTPNARRTRDASSAQTEVQSAARRLPEAQRRLARTYERDERDINALDRRLDALEWSVQQINAAAFKLHQGEALIIAAPAEWPPE